MNIVVTGGLGFIGSAFIRLILNERPDYKIFNIDCLTYAGNEANLQEVLNETTTQRYAHSTLNICDTHTLEPVSDADAIVNFAAETHVDRSIVDPSAFVKTNVFGVHALLEMARRWDIKRFVQVSTDEVYGHLGPDDYPWTESAPLQPRSPYSATKASGDLLALAYYNTYNVPVIITRGSNTYGPYQYPEKLIPRIITNLLDEEPIALYGDGLHIRDWIHVDDHARGILAALERGKSGEVYHIGSCNERTNREIAYTLLKLCDARPSIYLQYTEDRLGHDQRYGLDTTKTHNDLAWYPSYTVYHSYDGLQSTVKWYRENEAWWRPLKERCLKT